MFASSLSSYMQWGFYSSFLRVKTHSIFRVVANHAPLGSTSKEESIGNVINAISNMTVHIPPVVILFRVSGNYRV